jgi:hypothetical protein
MGVAKNNSQSLGIQGKSVKIDTVFPDLMQNVPLFRKSGTQKRDPPDAGVRQGGQEPKGILRVLFFQTNHPESDRTMTQGLTDIFGCPDGNKRPFLLQARKPLFKRSGVFSPEQVCLPRKNRDRLIEIDA